MHLFGLCHGKLGQRQIFSILDIRKIFLGALESQFGSKRGLKMPISVSYELNLTIYGPYSLENSFDGPFFWSMSWEM